MTEHGRLDDGEVAALTAEAWLDDGANRICMRAPDGASPGQRVVQHLTSLVDLRDLTLLADGVAGNGRRGTDAGGYVIDGDDAVVWDGGEHEATMSTRALTDLLARLVEHVLAHRDELAADDDTWADLADLAVGLRRSLAG